MTGIQFDDSPYTQLTSPARGDIKGVIKDISEVLPENQTKFITFEDDHQFGSWSSKVRSVTASANVTLANTDPMFIEIDPNGSNRDVTFPAKSDDNHAYVVRHSGSANTLTLKRSGGATITTLAAGEAKYIMPSTLKDFSALAGGSSGTTMTNSSISPTASDVAAVVNTRYLADISGLTANRNFVLPAGAAGDEIELIITTGDDTYALIIKGDTGITINGGSSASEWSRVFIKNEIVKLVATSSSNWQIEKDGRIPCHAILERQSAQSINSGSVTKVQLSTEVKDVGDFADPSTNYRVTIRRAGTYLIMGAVIYENSFSDQKSVQALIYIDGALSTYQVTFVSAAVGSNPGMARLAYEKVLTAAQYIELDAWHNQGSAVNTGTTTGYPQLIVKEVLDK